MPIQVTLERHRPFSFGATCLYPCACAPSDIFVQAQLSALESVQRLVFQLRPRQARIKVSCCHNQRQPYNGRVDTAGAENGPSRKQGPPAANTS